MRIRDTTGIANTWTADSGNTNGQRVIKTVTQLGGASASYVVGRGAVAAGAASSPYITPLGGGVLAFAILRDCDRIMWTVISKNSASSSFYP